MCFRAIPDDLRGLEQTVPKRGFLGVVESLDVFPQCFQPPSGVDAVSPQIIIRLAEPQIHGIAELFFEKLQRFLGLVPQLPLVEHVGQRGPILRIFWVFFQGVAEQVFGFDVAIPRG